VLLRLFSVDQAPTALWTASKNIRDKSAYSYQISATFGGSGEGGERGKHTPRATGEKKGGTHMYGITVENDTVEIEIFL
jgi:hypothetical protein